MKRFLFPICLLLWCLSVQAKIESYKCYTTNSAFQEISIAFDQCALTPSSNFDVCLVDQNKMIIAIDPSKSLLLAPNGDIEEFSCSEFEDEIPPTEQAPSPAPTRPATPSRTNGGGDPGHGGSNIRMRGMK